MIRRARVLVVDDLEQWREELVETLHRGGFEVDSVSSTADALERLNTSPYHLLALDIHWQQVSGADRVVVNLEVDGIRLKRNPTLQNQVALELEDLLCRLFHQAKSVLVRPLALGQSTTGVLWVQPFYNTGGGHAVVVKFGDFHKIEEEYANFKEYVQPFIGGGRNSTVLDVRRTAHLGGIMYSLLGADDEHLEDFGSFYRHADV